MTALDHLLDPFLDAGAQTRLASYFLGPDPKSGRRFERLGGGGDRAEAADHFDALDIVAVTLLGVDVAPNASIAILEDQAEALNAGLALVPTQTDLRSVPRAEIEPGSAADDLWHKLVEIDGIGPVIAGKLLARKRPHLLPILDQFVELVAGQTQTWWVDLWDTFRSDAFCRRLEEIRTESKIGEDISLLRVLDVSVWMASGVPPAG